MVINALQHQTLDHTPVLSDARSDSGSRTGSIRSASSSFSFPDTPPTLTLPQASQTASSSPFSSEHAHFSLGVVTSTESEYAHRRGSHSHRGVGHGSVDGQQQSSFGRSTGSGTNAKHIGWTSDDQSAASLLLEMTMPRNSSNSPTSVGAMPVPELGSGLRTGTDAAKPSHLGSRTRQSSSSQAVDHQSQYEHTHTHAHVHTNSNSPAQTQTPGSMLGIRIAPRPS